MAPEILKTQELNCFSSFEFDFPLSQVPPIHQFLKDPGSTPKATMATLFLGMGAVAVAPWKLAGLVLKGPLTLILEQLQAVAENARKFSKDIDGDSGD